MESKLEEYGEKLLRIANMTTYAGIMFLAADEIRDLKRQLNESRNSQVFGLVRPLSVD
jgi:hypothetical protein